MKYENRNAFAPRWRRVVAVWIVVLLLGLLWPALARADDTSNPWTPEPPTHVHATVSAGVAVISWIPPVRGGSPIASYTVRAYEAANNQLAAQRPVSGDYSSVRFIGVDRPLLKGGVAYYFTVSATNSYGEGSQSKPTNTIMVWPGATPPNPPKYVHAANSGSAALVNWTAPYDNGNPIAGYEVTVYFGESAGVVEWLSVPANSTSLRVSGLNPGQSYSFTVAAVNAAGWSADSDRSNPITPGASVPNPPERPWAQSSYNGATVGWTAPFDGGSLITSYTVTVYLARTAVYVGSVIVPGNRTTAAVAGLTNGRVYDFTIVAANDFGRSAESMRTNAVSLATAPGQPANVNAVAGIGSATVSWSPAAYDGGSPVTGYLVTAYLGYSSSVVTSISVGAAATSATFNGLSNGASYTFTVAAINGLGTGAASALSAPITLPSVPDAPRNVTATSGAGSAQVSWIAPASDGGRPISSYAVTVSDGIHPSLNLSGMSTGVTLTGLSSDTTYAISVVAINAVGQSRAASTSVTLQNLPPVLSVPGDQSVRYGHALSFDVTATDPESGDHLAISANGLPPGLTFADRGNGTGSVSGTAQVGAGSYPVTFTVSDGHTSVSRSLNIVVTSDTASVVPSSSNPTSVKVTGKPKIVTLRATIRRTADSQGNLANATQVTFTLTALDSGTTYTRAAKVTASSDSLGASVQLRYFPVDAYRIRIAVGGSYFEGSAESTLTVIKVPHGTVRVRGAVNHDGALASLNLAAQYLASGQLKGQLSYIEHRSNGDVTFESKSITGLIVKNQRAYIQGTAMRNGQGSYRFLITINRSPRDQFGLWIADGRNFSFTPIDLTSGGAMISAH